MIYLSRKQVKINILNIHLGVAKTPIKIFFLQKVRQIFALFKILLYFCRVNLTLGMSEHF